MLVERLERGESGVRERAGMKGNVRGCKGGSWGVILGRGGGGGERVDPYPPNESATTSPVTGAVTPRTFSNLR